MKKDENIFLDHILESILNIEIFVKDISKDVFLKNTEKQYAVTSGIEIIGEAAKNIPLEFRKEHQDIPWKQIAGMRDRLINNYIGVNLTRVWNVVKDDIPKLKEQIKIISKEKS